MWLGTYLSLSFPSHSLSHHPPPSHSISSKRNVAHIKMPNMYDVCVRCSAYTTHIRCSCSFPKSNEHNNNNNNNRVENMEMSPGNAFIVHVGVVSHSMPANHEPHRAKERKKVRCTKQHTSIQRLLHSKTVKIFVIIDTQGSTVESMVE